MCTTGRGERHDIEPAAPCSGADRQGRVEIPGGNHRFPSNWTHLDFAIFILFFHIDVKNRKKCEKTRRVPCAVPLSLSLVSRVSRLVSSIHLELSFVIGSAFIFSRSLYNTAMQAAPLPLPSPQRRGKAQKRRAGPRVGEGGGGRGGTKTPLFTVPSLPNRTALLQNNEENRLWGPERDVK